MTRTRQEWLDSLDWRDGPPPTLGSRGLFVSTNAGMVYDLGQGNCVIVGDINDSGGICGCCDDTPKVDQVVRWAMLFEEPKEGTQ